MTDLLLIGERAYSSWSLRGWLLFAAFGLPVRTELIGFLHGSVADKLSAYAPARTVPVWITPEAAVVSDSLAIAEELSTRHPDAGHWPTTARARAIARTLAAEVHSGFTALRTDCPMHLGAAYEGFAPSDAVRADLDRLQVIWDHARESCAPSGPWLCGDYSIADAFFAPVAARIATYGLPMGDTARAYVAAHLAHVPFRQWRAMALVTGDHLPWYQKDLPQRPWPGPVPRPARAIDSGTPENATCPYSHRPVTHLMEMDGRVFGFCNDICRDKTVADPEAWPEFMALVAPPEEARG